MPRDGEVFTRSCKLPFADDRVIWSGERYCLIIVYSLLSIYAALTLVFVCICICIYIFVNIISSPVERK